MLIRAVLMRPPARRTVGENFAPRTPLMNLRSVDDQRVRKREREGERERGGEGGGGDLAMGVKAGRRI